MDSATHLLRNKIHEDFHFESHFHFSHIDARLTPVDEGLCFFSSMDKPTPEPLTANESVFLFGQFCSLVLWSSVDVL